MTLKIQPFHPNVLEVQADRLDHNLTLLSRRASLSQKNQILIPVKANAYGCGMQSIIPYLSQKEQVTFIGVANVTEAIQARKLAWRKNILLLGGFFQNFIQDLFNYNIIPSITDLGQINVLEQCAKERDTIKDVHIKFDMGMGRIGLLPNATDIEALITKMKVALHLKITGIFTHFPTADKSKNAHNIRMIQQFTKLSQYVMQSLCIQRNDILLHMSNSYAIFNYPEATLDMIRPGLFFYGYFQNYRDYQKLNQHLPLKPSIKLTVMPISYRTLYKGSYVSYGSTYKVKKKELSVCVLPVGYADGIPCALSNNIKFGNQQLLGRVTMDQIILTSPYENYQPSQPICLLGDSVPPLEKWAMLARTHTYEILTRLANRFHRTLKS